MCLPRESDAFETKLLMWAAHKPDFLFFLDKNGSTKTSNRFQWSHRTVLKGPAGAPSSLAACIFQTSVDAWPRCWAGTVRAGSWNPALSGNLFSNSTTNGTLWTSSEQTGHYIHKQTMRRMELDLLIFQLVINRGGGPTSSAVPGGNPTIPVLTFYFSFDW